MAADLRPRRAGHRSATRWRRLLAAALHFELVWLLLVAVVIVFLASHPGSDSGEVTGNHTSDLLLLLIVPPVALVFGAALLGARQAVDRLVAAPSEIPRRSRRAALWLAALGNAAVVVVILISLYHARTTWMVVGLGLALGMAVVTAGCVRATRLRLTDRAEPPSRA
jgi:hypothetical protein